MTTAARLMLLAALIGLAPAAAPAAPRTLAQYLAQSGPAPTARLAYGPAPSQYVELFAPKGAGPFPVVVLIHGGCWQKDLGGVVEMGDVAGALVGDGLAVWNVEYRRVDEPGGGYPGTYQDVAAAMDLLRREANARHLDTGRLVAVGHSAGGQLVQWLAARGRIASGPLHEAHPLAVREVVSLGGLADLKTAAPAIRKACDLEAVQLTGQAGPGRPDPLADTSAGALLPSGAHTVLINGEFDWQSPPSVAADFAARARAAGDRAETIVLPGASHFDEVASASAAWPVVRAAILRAVGMGATGR